MLYMKQFTTIDDILDFAINAEQESVDFYTGLASKAKNAEELFPAIAPALLNKDVSSRKTEVA